MFQGTTLVTLDEKGRLLLPAKSRAEVTERGGTLVAVRHPDGCLVLYPADAWVPRREKLLAMPWNARGFVRFVLGSAVELRLDAAGRILVPADLRKLAELERECALVGLGEHFELWDRRKLRVAEEAALKEGLNGGDFTF